MTDAIGADARGERQSQWAGPLLLGLAVLSWLCLMSPLLSAGPLALDEHGSYWILDADLPGSVLERSLNYAAIPPLSSWVQQVFLTWFGKSEITFRMSSAVCGLAAIGVCYLAGKELGDSKVGGIAALLLAWHPEAMDEVRIARCYGLVLLLGAGVLWATIRWMKNPLSWEWTIGWSFASAALLWTHYTSALLVIVAGMTMAIVRWRKRELHGAVLGRLVVAALTLLVLCRSLVPSILRLQEWGPFLNFSGTGTSIGEVIGPFWWAGLPVGLFLCWLAGQGLSRDCQDKASFVIAGACSLLPLAILFWMSTGEMSSLANPRYRVAYAPAGACLAALLLNTSRHPRGLVAGTIGVLLVSWWLSPLKPWQLGRLNAPADRDWYELNVHLAAESLPDEPILVQSGLAEGSLVPAYATDPQFMEYVACRVSRFYVETSHPRLALPYLWDSRTGIAEFYRDQLNGWRESPGTFWVACATDTDLNRNSLKGIQELAEESEFEAVSTMTWKNATLIHYRALARPVK